MSEKKATLRDGATIPAMQKIVTPGSLKRGATIPGMQPVQRPQGSGQQGGGQGSDNSSPGGDKK